MGSLDSCSMSGGRAVGWVAELWGGWQSCGVGGPLGLPPEAHDDDDGGVMCVMIRGFILVRPLCRAV
jgi:hypothetical protein